jgi:hypothetical protein
MSYGDWSCHSLSRGCFLPWPAHADHHCGVCLQTDRKDLLLLFAAICTHKIFESMSMATRFLRLGCPRFTMLLLMLPYHLIPPLAMILASVARAESPVASLVLIGLSTGTFLYVGAYEVVSEEFAQDPSSTKDAHGTAIQQVATLQPVAAGQVEDQRDATVIVSAKTENVWHPSKSVKYAMYLAGCGVLLALSAALPHDH